MSGTIKNSTDISSLGKLLHGRTSPAVAGVIAAAAFLLTYRDVFPVLVAQWLSDDMYTHGFLIPAISFYLVWAKRVELRQIDTRPAYSFGLSLLLLGLVIRAAGEAGNTIVIEELSMPVTLAGIVALMTGFEFLKIIWFPIAYLFFMIPVWSFITEPLVPYYQKISAFMGSFIMQTAGVPVYRKDLFIELPHITLEIAKECSGIRYMIVVIAIGILLSYLFIRSWKRRAALIGMGVAIATIFNGVRIGIIGIMSYYGISSVLHGPGHILQGLSVSLSGFAALFGGLWLLSDQQEERSNSKQKMNPADRAPKGKNELSGTRPSSKVLPYLPPACVLVFLGTAVFLSVVTEPAPVPPKYDLKLFPQQFGTWQGTDAEPVFSVFNKMGFDQKVARRYEGPSREKIDVFLGYFETQRVGRKLGYLMDEFHDAADRLRIHPDRSLPDTIEINQTIRFSENRPMRVLFWYEVDQRIIADKRQVVAATTIARIMHRRSNGTFVMIAAPADADDAGMEVKEFAEKLMSQLREHLYGASGSDPHAPAMP